MDSSNIKIDFWGNVNIEKMFDIHDNQTVEIYTSGVGANNDKSKSSDVVTTESKSSFGARKQFLFADVRATIENVEVKNREKERFMRYLSDNDMLNRRLVTEKQDELNRVVMAFLKIWHDRKLVKVPSGGAVFRFLTNDCGLKTDVTDKSYGNKIKDWIYDNDCDSKTYQKVKTYF